MRKRCQQIRGPAAKGDDDARPIRCLRVRRDGHFRIYPGGMAHLRLEEDEGPQVGVMQQFNERDGYGRYSDSVRLPKHETA